MTEHAHAPAGHPGAHPGAHDPRKGHPAMGGPKTLEDGSPACKLIAWEVTRSCNLACKHCRAEAHPEPYPGELSTEEAKALIDTFPQVGRPIIIFTGGDPMMRADVYDLVAYTHAKGLICAFSPNGTLITPENARRLKEAGVDRCSISIDGADAASHDAFRGVPGAFKKALEGIANCQAEGLKVGLRFTINKRNVAEIPGIFQLLRDLEVPRACFYHLVYSGRGSELIKEDLDHAETRAVLDLIMDETRACFDAGKPKEILTVDNHADGPYVWMRLKREDPKRAEEVFELLQFNEGNNSGRGIGCISWDGQVHADQVWRNHTFGNVLERPFSQIWDDPSIELLHKLKDKKAYVGGRCAKCRFLGICGGNFRARAEAYYGDIWAQDPACYLTDEEIGL